MFNIFLTSLRYSFVEKANKTLYNLNKIPFLRKLIGDRFYKETDGKNVFGIIGFIFGLIGKFLGSLIMLFVVVKLPASLINEYLGYASVEVIQLQLLFVVSLGTSFLISSVFSNDTNAYNMIKLMRVNPKDYYLTKVITKLQENIIDLIVLFLLDINNPLFLVIEFAAFGIFGEYVQILLFDKFNLILCKKKALNICLWLLLIVLSYVPCVLGLTYDFTEIVTNWIFLIVLAALAVLSFIQMKKYKRYKDIVLNMNLNLVVNQNLEELNGDINFSDVKINNIKEGLLDSSKFNNKTGYEYLNSIFFFRNNRLVRRAIMFKCIIITVVMLVISVVSLADKDDIEETFKFLKNSSPYLLFIMYFLSSTERLCKAMFFNCDLSLLRYGFYKRKEDILKNFTSRIKKMLLYNSIHTFLLVIELILFILVIGKGSNIIEIIPVLISIISLSGFFTLYGVFMYYIVQPYTKNLEVKSPIFSFCNFVIFAISYACLKIKTASYIFTLGIIAITAMFIPVSIFCIYKYAHRTFKLK